MELSERGLQVLHAIVEDYVAAHEPVGSKTIVEKHDMGVSAATIRNDMAILEDSQLIAQPHTSSGRVPTDKGYRLYVDTLDRVRPLSYGQRSAINSIMQEPESLEDIIDRAVRLLAKLTQQVALAQFPTYQPATIAQFDIVPLGQIRALIVTIFLDGRVQQSQIRLSEAVMRPDWAYEMKMNLIPLIYDQIAQDAAVNIAKATAGILASMPAAERQPSAEIIEQVLRQLNQIQEDRFIIAGAANLSRRNDFSDGIAGILEALEEQVALINLFAKLARVGDEVAASIGRENEPYGLPQTAVITSAYDGMGESAARIGVLGPTKMDYAGNIACVRAVARYLGTHFPF